MKRNKFGNKKWNSFENDLERLQEKQERLNKIMKYAGSMEIDDKFKNLSDEELKVAVAKAKAKIKAK